MIHSTEQNHTLLIPDTIPDLTNQFKALEKWKLEAIWLIPNILSTSTSLHALLLTTLRLLCLEKPLTFKVLLLNVS